MMYQPFTPPFDMPSFDKWQKQQEKRRLRKDANYIGTLSLGLTLLMETTFTVVMIALMLLGIVSFDDLNGDPFYGLGNTLFLFLYMGVYTVALLLPAIVISLCFGKRSNPFAPTESVPFGMAFLAVIAAVGLCMLTNIINSFALMLFEQIGWSIPEPPIMMTKSFLSFLLNLFTMAVLPALLEEMIYRGYILRTLRPYGHWYAVLISAALFGVMHGNFRQIPFAFIVGIILGYLYVSTNNIWLPIAVHFANNAISVLMEYLSFYLPEAGRNLFYALIIYGFAFVGVIAALLLLLFYRKRMRLPKSDSVLSKGARFGLLFTAPLFIISIVVYYYLLLMEIISYV